ncbi:MAG: sigma 54-interacting transcriptional regulator, partial [Ignavibacteria bacterium]|nr:sigma 54-interacting transcriptional regulator [Ignavibacteria bacterium]
NRDLESMVENGTFRRDLYHRLNVVTIEIPPLKERPEDIIGLTNHFVEEFNKQFEKEIKKVDKDVQHFLKGYPWPGNVRELKNAIERAVLLSDNNKLELSDFSSLIRNVPVEFKDRIFNEEASPHLIRMDINYGSTNLRNLQKQYAKEVLKKLGGNKTQTARLLGVSRPKLDTLLKE